MPRDTVTIYVEEVVAETDLALCFSIDGEEVWVPKSVIEDGDSISKGDEDLKVEVASWFAEKEGLA